MKRAALFVALSGLLLGQDPRESVHTGSKEFRRTKLVSGLAGPWEVTWGPDDQLWVTERFGKRITRIDPSSGKGQVAVTIDEVSAPGSQDGLLGLALHPDLLQGRGADYVYASYTYVDEARGAHPTVPDPSDPYRFLYMKIVRWTYDAASGKLVEPAGVLAGLPAGNDHNAGRLKVGPDRKLYLTIGEHGHNQLGNMCLPIEAQRLPTQAELDAKNYASYVGKSLRIELDGSVPKDNPRLEGVVSHVYTYGHRNPQGLDFAPDGTIYSTEHGPKTDDEINILKAGANYGWPHVAGLQDDKTYVYARWAEATTPCRELTYNDIDLPASVPREPESAFKKKFTPPIATMFTVENGYNFENPACGGIHYICWPTVGVSSIQYYSNAGAGIPGWDQVLLATTLKRGSLYVWPLRKDGQAVSGHAERYFQSENRYRDVEVSPDGRTIYIATDAQGLVQSLEGGVTRTMRNPGAILAFTYVGEGGSGETLTEPVQTTETRIEEKPRAIFSGRPVHFSAEQAAAGKVAYNASCAVCHGSNLANGTFGTPLAGEYFQTKWFGRSVRELLDHAKTMPPAAPGSLPDEKYAAILAYVLQFNGLAPGEGSLALPTDAEELGEMAIR